MFIVMHFHFLLKNNIGIVLYVIKI